jgi:hypothetical protein
MMTSRASMEISRDLRRFLLSYRRNRLVRYFFTPSPFFQHGSSEGYVIPYVSKISYRLPYAYLFVATLWTRHPLCPRCGGGRAFISL